MPSSSSFLGSGLFIESVTTASLRTVDVVFGQIPTAVSIVGADDALNPSNYSLNFGSSNFTGLSVTQVSDRRFQVEFATQITEGVYVLTVSNVETVNNLPLVPNPGVFTFTSTLQNNSKPIAQGAKTLSSADAIKRHIGSNFHGKKNWDAIIAALASGDDYVQNLARNVFFQLFTPTASKNYLKQRGADQGFYFPTGVGMSDDDFRQLVIRLTAEKITAQSFQKVIEVFYGREAVRAYMDSTGSFLSLDEKTLVLDVDGTVIALTFYDSMFQFAGAPTAVEVSSILNQEFAKYQLQAEAEARTDSQGAEFVRIYSGRIGLGGRVSCLGGSAQVVLQFPSLISHETATVDFIKIPNSFKVTITDPADLLFRDVQAGDYFITNSTDFLPANRGQFEVLEANRDGNETSITIRNLSGVSQPGVSITAGNFLIFRPTVSNVNQLKPLALVAQASDETDIVMPVTSPRVNAQEKQAPYLVSNDVSGNEQNVFDLEPQHFRVTGASTSGLNTTLTFDSSVTISAGQKFYFGPSINVDTAVLNEGVYTAISGTAGSVTFVGFIAPGLLPTISANISAYISLSFVDSGNLTFKTSQDLDLLTQPTCQIEGAISLDLITGGQESPYTENSWNFFDINADLQDPGTGSFLKLSDGSIFYCGGSTAGVPSVKATIFNTQTLTKETVADMPLARAHSFLAEMDNKIYVLGGVDSILAETTTVQVYDRQSGIWTQEADMPYDLSQSWDDNGTIFANNTSKKNQTFVYGGKIFVIAKSATGFVNVLVRESANIWNLYTSTDTGILSNSTSGFRRGDEIFIVSHNDIGSFTKCMTFSCHYRTFSLETQVSDAIPPITNGIAANHATLGECMIFFGGDDLTDTFDSIVAVPFDLNQAPEVSTLPKNLTRVHLALTGAGDVVIIGGTESVGVTNQNVYIWESNSPLSGFKGVDLGKILPQAISPWAAVYDQDVIFSQDSNSNIYKVDMFGMSQKQGKLSQNYDYVSKTNDQINLAPKDSSLPSTFAVDLTNAKLIKNPSFTNYRDGEELAIGPYILDQKQLEIQFLNTQLSNSITLTSGIQDIQISQAIDKIQGFLVYGFGTQDTLVLLQIIENLGTTVKVNYRGSAVTLQSGNSLHYSPSKTLFSPTDPVNMGVFYVLDTSDMRRYAEFLISRAKAVGSKVNIELRYPGTQGLGNDTISVQTSGQSKLNDAIYIWGSQADLDRSR